MKGERFKMTDFYIELVGLLSTLFYGARWYFQIKATREARRSVTPMNYWKLTLLAQFTMVLYTYLLGSIVFPAFLIISITLQLYNINIERKRKKE